MKSLRVVRCFTCKRQFASKTALSRQLFADGKIHLVCRQCWSPNSWWPTSSDAQPAQDTPATEPEETEQEKHERLVWEAAHIESFGTSDMDAISAAIATAKRNMYGDEEPTTEPVADVVEQSVDLSIGDTVRTPDGYGEVVSQPFHFIEDGVLGCLVDVLGLGSIAYNVSSLERVTEESVQAEFEAVPSYTSRYAEAAQLEREIAELEQELAALRTMLAPYLVAA
ncbi:MAG TPA: hypothetical protein VFA10_18045 [Ktedonobacteraceae bacterium]|nr:hypothetical protein [Ktedonobacteraceae bacterium]